MTTTFTSPAPRHAMLHVLEPLGPEPVESPRRGLYVAFERIGLGWSWRCLRCNADGSGYTDELVLADACAHVCGDEEVPA